MASQEGSKQDEEIFVRGESPHFYKIILEKTIREGKFGIPKKFVKKFGSFLPSPIILKVPSGKSWEVELLKIEDEIWVEKGWQEFAQYHSLKYGHFVLFKYDGDCQFNVLIFDMSAVEIDYPGSGVPSMDPNHGRDSRQPMIRANEEEDASSCQILEDLTSNCCTSREMLDKKGISRQAKKPSSFSTCQAPDSANNFISSNYPSFRAVFRHENILSVPFSFVQSHMECETHTVMLKVANKTWPVKLNVYSRKHTAIFSAGWSAFAKQNSLKVGSAYNFELIKRDEMTVSKFTTCKLG